MTLMCINGAGFRSSEWRQSCRITGFSRCKTNHGLLSNGTARIVSRQLSPEQLGNPVEIFSYRAKQQATYRGQQNPTRCLTFVISRGAKVRPVTVMVNVKLKATPKWDRDCIIGEDSVRVDHSRRRELIEERHNGETILSGCQ
jgi:hypothetical protein